MAMAARLTLTLLIAVLLAPFAAFGQLYKWIDADGTVNYGDSPPKGAKNVRLVGKDSGNLTVVPGIPQEERDRVRQREEQQRLQQLEREVEELRAREEARANTPPEVIYNEVYVPVYGGRWPPPAHLRPPGSGPVRPEHPIGKPKPEHPIAKPRPPGRTPPVQELPGTSVPRDPPGTMIRR